MKRDNLRIILGLFLAFGIFLSACQEDDDEEEEIIPTIDRGHTEVDRSVIIFERIQGGTKTFEDSAVMVDYDGPEGNAPQILDSLQIEWFDQFNNPISYEANIRFYYNGNEVSNLIESKYNDYIVCYRDFQTQELNLQSRSLDPDGRTLGILTEWETQVASTTGEGMIRITLNYQPLDKNGLCDPGIRIFECNLPYVLN